MCQVVGGVTKVLVSSWVACLDLEELAASPEVMSLLLSE